MRTQYIAVRMTTAAVILMLMGTPVLAEDMPDGKYVTREEYDKLKNAFDKLQSQVGAIEKNGTPSRAETQEYFDDVDKELKKASDLAAAAQSGSTQFLITGYGATGFTDRKGENSTFSAQFNPIFLWKLSDQFFFEGEVELELEANDSGEGETATALEYAAAYFILNDYITIGAGKFLTPFSIFSARLHPAWINKLPDKPLVFDDGGLSPEASLGFTVRGGVPAGTGTFNYAFYVSNGPRLETAATDEVGKLKFDNFVDINSSKAVGGRIGFLPIPELEVGYSFQVARVNPDGFEGVDAVLQAIDAGYVRDADSLGGTITIWTEWVFSNVDDATYDPDGSLGFGPVTFTNDRNGGYVQITYRPSKNSNKVIKNIEYVFRYDILNNPSGAPGSFDENRYTIGVDYWFNASTVFKAAYQFDNRDSGQDDVDAFLLQAAMGF